MRDFTIFNSEFINDLEITTVYDSVIKRLFWVYTSDTYCIFYAYDWLRDPAQFYEGIECVDPNDFKILGVDDFTSYKPMYDDDIENVMPLIRKCIKRFAEHRFEEQNCYTSLPSAFINRRHFRRLPDDYVEWWTSKTSNGFMFNGRNILFEEEAYYSDRYRDEKTFIKDCLLKCVKYVQTHNNAILPSIEYLDASAFECTKYDMICEFIEDL